MKIIGLNIVILLLTLSTLTQARIKKSVRSSRKLDEEHQEGEGEEEAENVEDENPDLEMLEELENEMENGENGNIFQELVNQKKEMLERLKLLESMVNDDLSKHEDEDDPLNKNEVKNEHDHEVSYHVETHESWIIVHRHKLIKVAILVIFVCFFLLIGWKLSKMSADLIEKQKAVKLFQAKLEEVDEKEIDSLVATWKDQREGIRKLF